MADGQELADVEPEVAAAAPLPMVIVAPSNRELPPEVADEIGRFSDPRCDRCDSRLAGEAIARGRCDRCYEDESTERAISDVNGRYREDLMKTAVAFQSAVSRLIYGAQVWRDRLAMAQRQFDGPPLIGNEIRPGMRYLPLYPVYDTAAREIIGWQILEPALGGNGRLYRTPEAARDSAPARTRPKIRVLEIDIADQRDVDLSPAQLHEHAERMVFRWTEEEIATRPGARTEEQSAERGRDFMPPALRAMALSAQRTTEQTNTPHCLQCAKNLREIGLPFCVPCAADVLDKLGRAVSATASVMGQMEATDRTIGVVGRRENIPDGPDVAAEIEFVTEEEYAAVLGESLEITDLGTETDPGL